MKIEIITTKKKLTKSLVNQMQRANLNVLKDGTPLGYIINGKRGVYRVILIEYLGLYYIIEGDWNKRDKSVTRPIGRYYQYKKFDTSEQCGTWWSFYQLILAKAIDQIYI